MEGDTNPLVRASLGSLHAVRRLAVRRVQEGHCNTRPGPSQAENHNIWWCSVEVHHHMLWVRLYDVVRVWNTCGEVGVRCGRRVEGACGSGLDGVFVERAYRPMSDWILVG